MKDLIIDEVTTQEPNKVSVNLIDEEEKEEVRIRPYVNNYCDETPP
jgi:hypothetical protein